MVFGILALVSFALAVALFVSHVRTVARSNGNESGYISFYIYFLPCLGCGVAGVGSTIGAFVIAVPRDIAWGIALLDLLCLLPLILLYGSCLKEGFKYTWNPKVNTSGRSGVVCEACGKASEGGAGDRYVKGKWVWWNERDGKCLQCGGSSIKLVWLFSAVDWRKPSTWFGNSRYRIEHRK